MSGGVDSSVTAALLERADFDVTGVFMKFWSEPDKNGLVGVGNRCCSPEAEVRARKVAKILKIPFYVFNFEKEFKKRIVDYFLTAHKKGITPNPCVVCNKEIKFGLLLEKALTLSADFVATGHYARLKNVGSETKLLKAKDKTKDQSYFLWALSQKQLRRTLFPLGNYRKTQVRELAKELKLPFFSGLDRNKVPESQEICFVDDSIGEFLRRRIKLKPGKIINTRGEILGKHQGLPLYTIGQRKGIGLPGGPAFAKTVSFAEVASATKAESAGKPYYVLDKDIKKNFLVISKNERDLYKKELFLKEIHWISNKSPRLPLKIKTKIRYRQPLVSAVLYPEQKTKGYKLVFRVSQRAVTPGQSAVFFKGREVLGGAIIK